MRSLRSTAFVVFCIGFVVSLIGDAAHVDSGTTRYLQSLPQIWNSDIWFPFAVGGFVAATAFLAHLDFRNSGDGWSLRHAASPEQHFGLREAVLGIASVLALYALTANVYGNADSVTAPLCYGVAIVVWALWSPTWHSLKWGVLAALGGTVAEIILVAVGVAEYTTAADSLFGVAIWLPALYFATGAVCSWLWRALTPGSSFS